MEIERVDLEELKIIYLNQYNMKLNDKETLELGISLIELFKVLTKPVPKLDTNQKEVENESNA